MADKEDSLLSWNPITVEEQGEVSAMTTLKAMAMAANLERSDGDLPRRSNNGSCGIVARRPEDRALIPCKIYLEAIPLGLAGALFIYWDIIHNYREIDRSIRS
jgi:hypothetical protein